MSLVELQTQTKELTPSEFLEFARWIRELEADAWDNQIAADLESGRLDALLNEVRQDIVNGNIKAL